MPPINPMAQYGVAALVQAVNKLLFAPPRSRTSREQPVPFSPPTLPSSTTAPPPHLRKSSSGTLSIDEKTCVTALGNLVIDEAKSTPSSPKEPSPARRTSPTSPRPPQYDYSKLDPDKPIPSIEIPFEQAVIGSYAPAILRHGDPAYYQTAPQPEPSMPKPQSRKPEADEQGAVFWHWGNRPKSPSTIQKTTGTPDIGKITSFRQTPDRWFFDHRKTNTEIRPAPCLLTEGQQIVLTRIRWCFNRFPT
jgi:hypothetical protein